jgi:hypothetical protein
MINATSDNATPTFERVETGVWLVRTPNASLNELLACARDRDQLLQVGSRTFKVSLLVDETKPSARDLLAKGGPLE